MCYYLTVIMQIIILKSHILLQLNYYWPFLTVLNHLIPFQNVSKRDLTAEKRGKVYELICKPAP